MSRVRVMQVIARLNIGGPASHVVGLASGLDPEQFECLVVTGLPQSSEGDMTDLVKTSGVAYHVIPQLGRAVSLWDDLVSLVKLYRLIRRSRPHVVHTHTAKAGAIGRVAARLAGVPVVVHTFHGHVFHGYWGTVGSKITVWVERWLGWLATAILTVGESVRRELIAFRVAPPERIRVLPLGLDLEPFINCKSRRGEFRAELGLASDVPLVGIVGRMVPIKNHELFLQVARQLVDSGFQGRFVVIGGGELAAQIQRSASELELADRVYFTGWRRDLERVYADLDVLVNTALNEGTPVAIIEAMAARVPVVATAVGGVPDLIESGRTGFLALVDDPDEIAQAIRKALNCPDTMLAAAQAVVLDRHSLQPMLARAADLYQSLLDLELGVRVHQHDYR